MNATRPNRAITTTMPANPPAGGIISLCAFRDQRAADELRAMQTAWRDGARELAQLYRDAMLSVPDTVLAASRRNKKERPLGRKLMREVARAAQQRIPRQRVKAIIARMIDETYNVVEGIPTQHPARAFAAVS